MGHVIQGDQTGLHVVRGQSGQHARVLDADLVDGLTVALLQTPFQLESTVKTITAQFWMAVQLLMRKVHPPTPHESARKRLSSSPA